MSKLRSAGVSSLVLLIAASASAASFIVPSDRELVRAAKAIVIAKSVTSYSVPGADNMIYTVFEMDVDEVIKGDLRIDQRLLLVEPGGVLGHRGVLVPGSVGYRVGERALVFLDTQDDGSWRTWGMVLGKFNFVRDLHGTRLLLRGQDEGAIFGWDAAGSAHHEAVRAEEKFLQYVRAEACGTAGDASYTLDESAIVWNRKVKTTVNGSGFHACDYVFSGFAGGFGCGAKWPNGMFDQPGGAGSAGFSIVGTQSGGVNGATAAAAGANAWNADSLSNVNLSIGSGSNQIKFDDNAGAGACGAPAVGCTSVGSNLQTFTFDGGTFVDIAQVLVSIRASFTSNQSLLNQIVCHELGHGLGFRHSADSSPSQATAVMMASANAGSPLGANLQPWDTDAVETVYNPSPGVTCSPVGVPTVSANPTTIQSGQSSQLSASATGTNPTFTWFTGSPGNTSNQVGTGASISVSPTTTTSYWVRATNSCTTSPVNSASSVTVTVQCVAPTQANASANPTTIVTGGSTQLTVAANGSGPLSFQWFTGNPPSGSLITGATSQTIQINNLTTTTTFYVQVSNSCGGPINSNAVTVTVQPCTPPAQATATAQPTSITAGGSTQLSVTANGTGPFTIQWFTGFPPGGSQIFGATTASIQQSPGVTTSYYAQVTNACGGPINSNAVTVTVTSSCTPPSNAVATATPGSIQAGQTANLAVSANGTGLTFQWFTGTPPNGTAIIGATSANVPVTPAATTTYFARVTGQCGNPNPIDSNAVTVTVAAACVDPAITTHPHDATIVVGSSATLTVAATGTPTLHFQWFEGATGDTSKPRGADSPTFNTGPLTKKTQYWVQVRGTCPGDKRANSNTATVDVKSPRNGRPVKH